jgi:hypothetical protein
VTSTSNKQYCETQQASLQRSRTHTSPYSAQSRTSLLVLAPLVNPGKNPRVKNKLILTESIFGVRGSSMKLGLQYPEALTVNLIRNSVVHDNFVEKDGSGCISVARKGGREGELSTKIQRTTLAFDIKDLGGGKQCPLYSIVYRGKTVVSESRPGLEPADSPGKSVENNHIILNLNDRCPIEDTSCIKPGKVIREIGLTTAGVEAPTAGLLAVSAPPSTAASENA